MLVMCLDRLGRDLQALMALCLMGSVFILPAVSQAARNVYVPNITTSDVSVIGTSNNTVADTVSVDSGPRGVAITPDGSYAYVPNYSSNSVSVIGTSNNTVVATVSEGMGTNPFGVAMTPDGSYVYVTNFNSNNVSVISTSDNTVVATVLVGTWPWGVAITPDGSYAYVSNIGSTKVSVIKTSDNTVVNTVTVGSQPSGVAITPDGSYAYVANFNSDNISVIKTSDNTVVGTVAVGTKPGGVAITPDGLHVYVANRDSNNVSVISTSNNTVVGTVTVGTKPILVAITPDGSYTYVTNWVSNSVSVIGTSNNTVVATVSEGMGTSPWGVAVVPNQAPTAAFTASAGIAGEASSFNASTSTDSDGTIARYDWDFGDGDILNDGGATPSHTYSVSGTYTATLTVTDNEGCSTSFVFTGQTAFCNGSSSAATPQEVTVAAPLPLDASPPANATTPVTDSAPVLSSMGVSHRCMRSRSKKASRSRLKLKYNLSEDAAVTISIRRRASTRKAFRKCPSSRSGKKKPGEVQQPGKYTEVETVTQPAKAGDNNASLSLSRKSSKKKSKKSRSARSKRSARSRAVVSRLGSAFDSNLKAPEMVKRGKGKAGSNAVNISVRLGKNLKPGTYKMYITAKDSVGNTSSTSVVKFWVLKRR